MVLELSRWYLLQLQAIDVWIDVELVFCIKNASSKLCEEYVSFFSYASSHVFSYVSCICQASYLFPKVVFILQNFYQKSFPKCFPRRHWSKHGKKIISIGHHHAITWFNCLRYRSPVFCPRDVWCRNFPLLHIDLEFLLLFSLSSFLFSPLVLHLSILTIWSSTFHNLS